MAAARPIPEVAPVMATTFPANRPGRSPTASAAAQPPATPATPVPAAANPYSIDLLLTPGPRCSSTLISASSSFPTTASAAATPWCGRPRTATAGHELARTPGPGHAATRYARNRAERTRERGGRHAAVGSHDSLMRTRRRSPCGRGRPVRPAHRHRESFRGDTASAPDGRGCRCPPQGSAHRRRRWSSRRRSSRRSPRRALPSRPGWPSDCQSHTAPVDADPTSFAYFASTPRV